MNINIQRANYAFMLKQQQIEREQMRPIEPVSQINPSMHIPDNAYLEAMQVLGTNIDIKV